MKYLLVASLLMMGCSAGSPAQVGGQYQGFLGAQLSDKKIGCQGELKQTGDVVLGDLHLSIQKSGKQYDLDCSTDGSVKGKNVTLRVHGKQEKFELKIEGEFSQEGDPRIFGNAYLEGMDGAMPVLLKRLK